MPVANLFRRLAARHAAFVFACAALLGLFQFLICAAVSSVDVSGALRTVVESLPPMLQSFAATQFFGGFTSRGLLAFGWNHPVAHAAGTAVAILLAARAIAGEIEAGIMELHLSHPVSRLGYLVAYGLFAAFALAVLTTIGIAGTVAGQRLFGLDRFAGAELLRLGLAYFMLQAAWFGVTLTLSAFGREGGRVASVAFVVALASYFAEFIGRLWERAAFVLPWSLHHHYSPQAFLVQHASPVPDLVVLAAVALAGVALAALRFARRDLP